MDAAIRRGLPLIEKIGAPVFRRRGCVSCHNNTQPAQVVAEGRRRGFPVDEELAARELRQVAADPRSRRQSLIMGSGIPEIYGYILLTLDAARYAPDANTDLAVHQTAFRQEPEGDGGTRIVDVCAARQGSGDEGTNRPRAAVADRCPPGGC